MQRLSSPICKDFVDILHLHTSDNARQQPRKPTVGLVPCSLEGMANDEKGATEGQVEKIDTIVGSEVLGYEGAGREEHSGENAPTPPDDLRDELADNQPEDVK